MTAKTKYIYMDKAYKEYYVYGGNPKQAAMSLSKRLNTYISPEDIKPVPEVKPAKTLFVYTFARKTSAYDRTSYEEILAVSEKQAWFFFKRSRGTQFFALIDSIRKANDDDRARLKFGVIYDVTW